MATLTTRDRMVESGLALLRRQGYAETSWRTLVQESQTPFGSIRHFFPGGKDQLVAEALELFVDRLCALLDTVRLANGTPGKTVEAFFSALAAGFEQDDWALGCPLASVALDVVPRHGAMTEACQTGFAKLAHHFEEALGDAGVDDAVRWADRIMVAMEGGLVVGRMRRSADVLRESGRWLAHQLDAVPLGTRRREK